MLSKIIALVIVFSFFVVLAPDIFAHRDGCHSKHSCESDTGSYTCGDTGNCSQCTDNQYCQAGKPIRPNSTPIILKKQADTTNQKIGNTVCKGKTMCISGTIKNVVDGDTLYIGTYKVRLSLTNTPEKGQPGYSEATKITKNLCTKGTMAIIDQDDLQPFDQYKRVLGKVYCSDKNLNSELLQSGYAKITKRYCKTSEFASEPWATKFGC